MHGYSQIIQVFPSELHECTYPDKDNPGRLLGRSEVERREQHFLRLERTILGSTNFSLIHTIKKCLDNDPSERPTAEKLVTILEEARANIDGIHGEISRIDAVRHVVMVRSLKKRDAEVNEKEREILQLRQQLQKTQVQVTVRLSLIL